MLAEVRAFYDDYGRGHDGMQLPYVTAVLPRARSIDRRRAGPTTDPGDERVAPDGPIVCRRHRRPTCCSSTSGDGCSDARMVVRGPARRWYAATSAREADRATFRTLHTASLASPALREGLTAEQRRAQHPAPAQPARHARRVALTDTARPAGLATAPASTTPTRRAALAATTVERGSTRVADRGDLPCDGRGCEVRHAIVSPLVVEERVVGTLQVVADRRRPAGLRPGRRRGRASGSPASSSSPSSTPPAPG